MKSTLMVSGLNKILKYEWIVSKDGYIVAYFLTKDDAINFVSSHGGLVISPSMSGVLITQEHKLKVDQFICTLK